ncbi:MAG TPA: FCD domain-containing protein [Pseudonocardia sp.]|jgi:DNA-binding FadR family transcriptional regulator|nr:FCD domain-containing protein [Pseudonocardia sp.]
MSFEGNGGSDDGERSGSRRSRAQQVAADLEARILAERYTTGTRLGLRTELISHYSVSPAVMNEALRILRERNLVEVRPGPNGGVFVANPPPQVRLGGIDVWHQGLMVDPDQLFEARRHLDALFAPVALQRCAPEDIRAMEWAVEDMRAARDDARALLDATMRLHMAIARASRIEVLIGMYQTIVATLSATMTKAAFVPHAEELRQHSLELHAGLVNAIRDKDTLALEKLLALHSQDMVRVV